jgi:hypothetical protein
MIALLGAIFLAMSVETVLAATGSVSIASAYKGVVKFTMGVRAAV